MTAINFRGDYSAILIQRNQVGRFPSYKLLWFDEISHSKFTRYSSILNSKY